VYNYFVSLGVEILDSVECYDGVHGLFLHTRKDGSQYVKVGYHEGIVDSETWLAVQDKKNRNSKYKSNGNKVKNSWLLGLLKCPHCEMSVGINYNVRKDGTKNRRFVDFGFHTARCKSYGLAVIKPNELEDMVFEEIKAMLNELSIKKSSDNHKIDKVADKLRVKIAYAEHEIESYMEKLLEADEIMYGYISEKVGKLHKKKLELEEEFRAKVRKTQGVDSEQLEEPMARWNELSLEEKHELAKLVIEVIYLSDSDGVDIRFRV
jgi:hypothetical protein